MNFPKLIFFSFLILFSSGTLIALDSEEYVHFPSGESVSGQVFFFWQDSEVLTSKIKPAFKLSLSTPEGKKILERNVSPSANGEFLEFALPDTLSSGEYRYNISCFRSAKESTERFSGANRYPVQGSFTVAQNSDLPEHFQSFPQWYSERHINKIENGYNSLFFLSSGTFCGAFAYLMFTILDFNIITRIIGYVFAASAVTGYGASSYYCYRYFTDKNEIDTKYHLSREAAQDHFKFAFNHSW